MVALLHCCLQSLLFQHGDLNSLLHLLPPAVLEHEVLIPRFSERLPHQQKLLLVLYQRAKVHDDLLPAARVADARRALRVRCCINRVLRPERAPRAVLPENLLLRTLLGPMLRPAAALASSRLGRLRALDRARHSAPRYQDLFLLAVLLLVNERDVALLRVVVALRVRARFIARGQPVGVGAHIRRAVLVLVGRALGKRLVIGCKVGASVQ